MRIQWKAAIIAAIAGAPMAAWAEPGLGGEVYGATVTRGQTEIEARTAYLNGGQSDGEWNFVGEWAHAYTNWWRPAVLFELDHEAGENSDLEAVGFENLFDFTATRNWPVHFGGYLEYEFNTRGAPDAAEVKLLAERERGPLRLRFNAIGERQLGGVDDWEFGYAAQAMWAFSNDFRLGVEGYGDAGTDSDFDLDDHGHYWGPVAQFEAVETQNGELEVSLGYLAGVDAAEADGQLRLTVEWER